MDIPEKLAAIKEMFQHNEPKAYSAAGKPIACSHCGGMIFVARRIFVYGPMSHCLTCVNCGLASLFEETPGPQPG